MDNGLLSRCYAACVAPRRLRARAGGDGDKASAALAALPAPERALAVARYGAQAELGAAEAGELRRALGALEDALAEGPFLVPGVDAPTLADAFAFPARAGAWNLSESRPRGGSTCGPPLYALL